jgi:exosortase K
MFMVDNKGKISLGYFRGLLPSWAVNNDVRLGALLLLFSGTAVLKYLLRFVSVDNLQPILAPTALFVHIFTGLHFSWIPFEGYYNPGNGILINDSCAGSGFLLLCWALSAYHYICINGRKNMVKLIALFFLAIPVTVLVNAFRIISSLYFVNYTFSGSPIPSLHKAIGITAFLSGLIAFNFIAQTFVRKRLINETTT